MPKGLRYLFIWLLVGCMPPPAGGYPQQTYPYQPSQYCDGDCGNGDYDNGDYNGGDYGTTADYGNAGYGDDAYGDVPGNNGGGGRTTPRNSGSGAQWSCTAEASFGTARGTGPMNYSVKSGYGMASNRDDAVTLALKDCGETVNTSILINDDMQTEIGTCALSRCTKIGR